METLLFSMGFALVGKDDNGTKFVCEDVCVYVKDGKILYPDMGMIEVSIDDVEEFLLNA